jgi:hypothetical protein
MQGPKERDGARLHIDRRQNQHEILLWLFGAVNAERAGLYRALTLAIHPFFLSQVFPIGRIGDDDAVAGKLSTTRADENM